ncbi:MAG: hypothetical protein ACI9OJ_005692, partial [Myxococcota bacterium]
MSFNRTGVFCLSAGLLLASCGDEANSNQASDAGVQSGEDSSAGGDAQSGDTGTDAGDEMSVHDDEPMASSCGEDGEIGDCLEPADVSLRVDDETKLGFESVSFDAENKVLTLILADGAELPGKVVKGGVLYRNRKDRPPFAIRIVGVEQNDRTVKVKVQRAKLRDVYKKGRIRRRIPMNFDMMAVPAGAPGKGDVGISIGPNDCSALLADIDSKIPFPVSLRVDLTKCKFVLSGWVDAHLTWGGILPSSFEFVVGGGIDAALTATISMNGSVGINGEVLLVRLAPIPINILGLQLTISTEIFGGYRIGGAGEFGATAGFEYDASAEAGFGWTQGGGFYDIWDTSSNFTQVGPDLSFGGAAYAEVYVKPKISVLLWGLVGGYAAVEAYADLNVSGEAHYTPADNWVGEFCWELAAGITPSVGATLQIFGQSLLDEEVTLPSFQVTLAEDCVEGSPTVAPGCTESNLCATDLDCDGSAGNCRIGHCNPDKGCSCTYQEKTEGCCYTIADCDPVAPGLQLTCFFSKCASYHIPGYCEKDDDCSDDKATTVDTCDDNHCEHSAPTAMAFGPDSLNVCTGHEDCEDGDPLTMDTCEGGTCEFNNVPVFWGM